MTYRAILDVPRELLHHLAGLLTEHRRQRGTRRYTRALPCLRQALLALVWFRTGQDLGLLAWGFGISRATAYRYRDEAVAVLAATCRDLHDALHRAAADGWTSVILDGNVLRTDRCAATTIGTKKKPVHVWYSGKHRCFGGTIQAVIRPGRAPAMDQ